MKKYKPLAAGENISETAQKMVAMANETKDEVVFNFNGIELTAKPNGNTCAIVNFYWEGLTRRHEERKESSMKNRDIISRVFYLVGLVFSLVAFWDLLHGKTILQYVPCVLVVICIGALLHSHTRK